MPAVPPCRLCLVFTGHMIDAPGRPAPRFPPRMEARAAEAIRKHVIDARTRAGGSLTGVASGARGGDILFHEICLAEGIATKMVLPFAPAAFIAQSVRGVKTGRWITRFRRLWERLGPAHREVLDLSGRPDPFGACNGAMLNIARAQGEAIELLALWDGKAGKKPGGTAAFVNEVQTAGGRIRRIDSSELLASLGRRSR